VHYDSRDGVVGTAMRRQSAAARRTRVSGPAGVGRRPRGKVALALIRNVLVLYNGHSMYTPTVQDYVDAFARYSRHDIHYLHVDRETSPRFDLADYDAVLISYSCRLCYPDQISPAVREALRSFDGLKAAFVQDEYQLTNRLRDTLVDLGADVVFTCV